MGSPFIYLLALITVILGWFLGGALRNLKKDSENYRIKRAERLETEKSTHFLEEGDRDNICGICFGEFEEYTLYECQCGKVFHTDCMQMTKECPYCKSGTEDMIERPVKKAICPICGNVVKENVCECGTVKPNRDKTFKCVCGATMLITESECRKCGARYESFYKP